MAKILIVDDEPLTVEMLSTFLNLSGHTPIGALSNSQTWDKLAYEEPDAILLDIMLPDGNGLEICRAVACQPEVGQRACHHHLGAFTAYDYRSDGSRGQWLPRQTHQTGYAQERSSGSRHH